MAYIKNTWVDQEVERPKTYEMVNNPDGSITLVDSFGLVSELGTPVNADNMNHIEEGLADTDVTKYNPNTSYSLGDWVTGIVNNKKGVFSSLKDNNSGKPLTDTTSWEEVNLGGSGSGLFVGQTIFSLDPLVEDGLHLLDGQVLPAGGIYDQFINTYIANLYQKSPQRFCTESDWQASVSQYGVCGKYVYEAGVSVRLPKVTGFVEGTLDSNALGDLVGAGLPNITGEYYGTWKNTIQGTETNSNFAGAFYGARSTSTHYASGDGAGGKTLGFNASLSNPIYGNSDTVQPQSILGYMYIVVATTTKTDIEVNIDNVVTDLNNKVDISNMVEIPTIIEVSDPSLMPSWYRVYSDGWCEQGGRTASNVEPPQTVIFLKSFKDLNYNSSASIGGIGSVNDNTFPISTLHKATTSMVIENYNSGSGENNYYEWEAKGYIK